ncbi:hypothetical protein ACWF62_14995 [Rhodococcus sp. NPDC054953]
MSTPLDPTSIDLSDLLEQPGTTTVSSQSIDAGIATHAGVQASSSLEVTLDPAEGISAVIEGGVAADAGYDAYGSYDSLDASADTDAGTTDVSVTSVDGVASGDAGIAAGGGLGISLDIGESGLPELDIAAESGLDAYGDSAAYGSYDATDIHQDSGLDIG